MVSVFLEARVQKTSNIFQHNSSWTNLSNQTNCFRKQVTLIILT